MTRIFLLALSLAVGACASGDGQSYPSLAPRAVETQGFEEPAAPVAVVAPDPALDAQLAASTKALDSIVQGFDRDAAAAGRAAASAGGRPAGSEPWIEAQTALAQLDDWRAQSSALATDVEALSIARAATLAPPYPALVAFSARIEAEGVREGATIARLQRQLAPA